MGKFINETGSRFGRLVVLHRAKNRKTSAYWQCQCDCGGKTETSGNHLRSGHSTSCGCIAFEKMKAATTTHGFTKMPIYKVWKEMRARCNRQSHARFHSYGGRGIFVCDTWNMSFEEFLKDVGGDYKSNLQLDRIDNNGNYEPGNTRWVDAKTNVRNSRTIKIDAEDAGAIKSMLIFGAKQKEIARNFGVSAGIVASINCKKTWTDISPLVAL